MNTMESLGKYLRRERETKKISLKEVAKNIKVREQFLKALEEDRHDLLPSTTYVKGFLSALAKYIGLDSNEVLLRYESLLKGEPAPEEEVPSEKKISSIAKYRWVIGGGIIAGFVAVCLLLLFPAKPPMEPVSPKPEAKTISPSPPPPQAAEKSTVPEEKSITLQLKAVERTWVSIQLDDQPERDIMLQSGESISYQATKRIQMVVGNAGGLDLIFNDKQLERFGKPGEVFILLFTPEGVEGKRREETQPPEE
jgi:transcriptional regulator with XRE-family HTH domain